MVPPDSVFGVIPTWIAVYVLAIGIFAAAGFVLYQRVFRLILLGKDPGRFDQPVRRLVGALPYIFGQRKVLQSVSLRDRAGLAHFIIFWGFLSFTTSYILYIFGDVIWHDFSATILTDTGVRIFTAYLDILALVFFVVLIWAAVRRWAVKPNRLSFDLTQKARVGDHPAPDRIAHALHVAHRGVLRRRGRDRPSRRRPDRASHWRGVRQRRNRRRPRQRPPRRLLVAPPRDHPWLLPVHPHVQAHAPCGCSNQLLLAQAGGARHTPHS